MADYNKKKIINASPSLIPAIADRIRRDMELEGFEIETTPLVDGGSDLSITKGGLFRAILGMKSALKVLLQPHRDGIYFEASVGIFGQQLIPTVISMLFYWPVLITQIWGLVNQSKLDDKVLEIVERYIAEQQVGGNAPQQPIMASATAAPAAVMSRASTTGAKFCPDCGMKTDSSARFCSRCGHAF